MPGLRGQVEDACAHVADEVPILTVCFRGFASERVQCGSQTTM